MLLEALKPIPGTIQIVAGQTFHELDAEKAREWLEQGFARAIGGANSRGWSDGLRWDGADVAILASGESLSVEQCDAVRCWRDAAFNRRYVIAINTTFRRALWADLLYACDGTWWEGKDKHDAERYIDEARRTFAGELWTQDTKAAAAHKIKLIRSEAKPGLSRKPGVIHQGHNGGFQAINLAYLAGAARVFLLGYDMKGRHWHGEHPGGLRKVQRFDLFLRRMAELAADVAKEPAFDVINCTPGSACKSFPAKDWREVFA